MNKKIDDKIEIIELINLNIESVISSRREYDKILDNFRDNIKKNQNGLIKEGHDKKVIIEFFNLSDAMVQWIKYVLNRSHINSLIGYNILKTLITNAVPINDDIDIKELAKSVEEMQNFTKKYKKLFELADEEAEKRKKIKDSDKGYV